MAEYQPGDVVNGHVWTGTQWLRLTGPGGGEDGAQSPAPTPEADPPPAAAPAAASARPAAVARPGNRAVVIVAAVAVIAIIAAAVVAGLAVSAARSPAPAASGASSPAPPASGTQAAATTAPASPTPSSAAPSPSPSDWAPAGWVQWSDTIALQVQKPGTFVCRQAPCTEILLLARDGCPSSLYVEISSQNAAREVIGRASELLGAVEPMQQARAQIYEPNPDARHFDVTRVDCT